MIPVHLVILLVLTYKTWGVPAHHYSPILKSKSMFRKETDRPFSHFSKVRNNIVFGNMVFGDCMSQLVNQYSNFEVNQSTACGHPCYHLGAKRILLGGQMGLS